MIVVERPEWCLYEFVVCVSESECVCGFGSPTKRENKYKEKKKKLHRIHN